MKRKIIAFYPLIALLLIGLTGFGQSQLTQDSLLNRYLEIQNHRLHFNGVALVTKNNQPLAQASVGFASQELNTLISTDTKFKIASITKTFTAYLAIIAEKEGILSLSAPITTWFPQADKNGWDKITVEQLLHHTSGIPHWSGIEEYWPVKSKLSLSQEEALVEIFSSTLTTKPLGEFHYSSLGYYLISVILEKTYDLPFHQLIDEKITRPLGMENTGVCRDLTIVPNMSHSYHLIGDDSLIVAPSRSFSMLQGGGNLYSTASDLAIWGNFLLNNLTQPNQSKSQKSKLVRSDKKTDVYNRGFYVRAQNDVGRKIFHVGGGSFGCTAKLVLYPKENTCIVILSNISTLPLDDIIWPDIEKIIFKENFTMPVEKERFTISNDRLNAFTGRYQAENGMQLIILMMQEKLFARLGNNPPFEIHNQGDNRFFSKKINVEFSFETTTSGEVTGLITAGRGRTDYFKKQ